MIKKIIKGEKGFSVIDVMVTLVLLGIIGVAFLGALSTASKVNYLSDERTSAESLARTEMEYVRKQPYYEEDATFGGNPCWPYQLPLDPPKWDLTHTLPAGYEDYVVIVLATDVPVLPYSAYDSIQKITVTVQHPAGDDVLTLVSYKANR